MHTQGKKLCHFRFCLSSQWDQLLKKSRALFSKDETNKRRGSCPLCKSGGKHKGVTIHHEAYETTESNFMAWWSGGAMVLGKLPQPESLCNLVKSRTMAYCAYSRCGLGLFGHFFLAHIISLFFLPSSGSRPDTDLNIVSNGP